jgi:hypothetical protein
MATSLNASTSSGAATSSSSAKVNYDLGSGSLPYLRNLTNGVLIDFQYFRNKNNEIMIKELAIMNMVTKKIQCITFKFQAGSEWDKLPDYVKRTNNFICDHVNGMNFFDGTYDYDLLPRFLLHACKNNPIIYAKGSEKCQFLSSMLGKKVYNLELIKDLFNYSYMCVFRSRKYCKQFMSCFNEHKTPCGVMYCSLNKLFRIYDRLQQFKREQSERSYNDLVPGSVNSCSCNVGANPCSCNVATGDEIYYSDESGVNEV